MDARAVAAVGLSLFVGCCPKPCPEPRIVQVPVQVPCPEPPVLAWPEVPVYKLDPKATAPEVGKAYVESVRILEMQLWQAFRLLDGYRYRTPPATPPKDNILRN